MRTNAFLGASIRQIAIFTVLGVSVAHAGSGRLGVGKEYATGNHCYDVVVADFNNDGVPDLATTNLRGTSVSVLLGNGDGTFQQYVNYAVASGPAGLAAADFNGDGKRDLVVTTSSSLSVLLGNGNGTFQPHVDFPLQSTRFAVAAGDLNGDGKQDAVVASFGTIGVLLGNGDGTFQAEVTYPAGTGDESVVLGDLNHDGFLDAATNSQDGVSVLLGNGDGSFRSPVTYAAAGSCLRVALGDFNNDRNLDLAASCQSLKVSVLLGKGDGTFPNHMDMIAGSSTYAITVGDLNGDNKQDVVVVNADQPGGFGVLLGKGDGTFKAPQNYLVRSQFPSAIAVRDLNHDSAADVVVADQDVMLSVLMNVGGTQMRLTSSANPETMGQAVTFTAFVHPSMKSSGTPGGLVKFLDGAILLGTVPLVSSQASFTVTGLTVGDHQIKAVYSGDSVFNRNQRTFVEKVTE